MDRTLKPGHVIELSPFGAKFVVTKTDAETNGRSFEVKWERALVMRVMARFGGLLGYQA